MKRIIFCLIVFFIHSHLFANFCILKWGQDSTLKDRFVVSLLNDFEKEGRWIYVLMYDSCDNKGVFKIVPVSNLYKAFKPNFDNNVKKNFIFSTSITILQHNAFSNCGHADNPIIGIEVNFDVVSQLIYLSDEELLTTYFDKNKYLRAEQKRNLNELIAACFLKNIKVITDDPDKIHYEIFR